MSSVQIKRTPGGPGRLLYLNRVFTPLPGGGGEGGGEGGGGGGGPSHFTRLLTTSYVPSRDPLCWDAVILCDVNRLNINIRS